MTLSALFSVSGLTDVQAYPIAYDATATFVIQSLTGIETISWSIVGTSKSTQAALVITPAGTPSGASATCVMPADPGDGLGRSFIVKLTVSNQQESATSYRVFGAANSAGIIPVCSNEELYRHATHGYTDVFNEALNAIGGAAGGTLQLLYNNAGSIDGASGITVVGSETALAFGAVPATTGTLRGSNGFGLYVRNSENTADVHAIGVGSDEVVVVGDATNAVEVDIRSTTNVDLLPGGSLEYRFTSATIDCNQNSITDASFIELGAGTVATTGLARAAHAQIIISGRNQAGSANSSIVQWGIGGNNWLIFGSDSALNIYATATGGSHVFWVNSVEEMTITASTVDIKDNTLANVGDFDHDGTNFGVYGTAPIAKQTGVAVSAAGVHAALVNLGFISA